ncbi:FAD-binding protein [Sphingobium lactosutens]|uniref:FAD-binding protein n=1 Tax=Sphingobium lactosutens TaxID=522773 RepID=UPI0015BEBC6F|nr:FAD-binding protein [Sphingobium lactosutens]
MPILPPIIVENANEANWDAETDVAIVGFGGAGACAALEAHENGAKVMILDRFAGGGATRFSGGVIYAGGGTRIQREAGVEDTPEEMARYLRLEVGDAVSPDLLRRYCEGSRAELEWLMKQGVPFDSSFYKEKTVYPPEGYFLQYSGNEKSPAFASVAKPAARGHRTVGTGFSGYVFYDRLREAVERAGIKILEHSPVTRLVMDAAGRVIGIEARSLDQNRRRLHQKLFAKVDPMTPFNAGPAARSSRETARLEQDHAHAIRIRARKGVVLATGGFSHNLDMLKENVPFIASNIRATMRMASLGCNGSGHRLGLSAGGRTRGMDRVYLGRVMAPPAPYLRGIMVNRSGERFCSEDAYNSILGAAILAQPEGAAWLILNARDLHAAVRQCLLSGWATFRYFGGAALLNLLFGRTRRARSIGALGGKIGLDPAALENSVARYNQTMGAGDAFGKLPENRVPIEGASFYAVNFSIANIFAFSQLFTIGGLLVDEDSGQVLGQGDEPVQGLYAAGRTAFGLCSNQYVSGLSIGDCVFSGRRAGRHAASTS